MADIEITIDGGTSKRLLTAGKYCDRDILVTATGGGGGEGMAFLARSSSKTWDSTQEISCSLSCIVGELVLAVVMHRDDISTPDGWTLLFCGADIKESAYDFTQRVSVFSKIAESDTETFFTSAMSSQRAIITMSLILNSKNIISVSDVTNIDLPSNSLLNIKKQHSGLAVHVVHRILAAGGGSGLISINPDFISTIIVDRLSVIIDNGPILEYEVRTESFDATIKIAHFSIAIPKGDSNRQISYNPQTDTGIYDLPAHTALNIITGGGAV